MTASMTLSMAPASVICFRPRFSMMSSAPWPSAHMASNTSLAIFPEMVASTMRASRPLSAAGDTREAVISTLSRLSALDSSPMTQFAASLACALPKSASTASKYAPSSRLALRTPASYAESPRSRANRAAFSSGNSGNVARTVAMKPSSISTGRRSGSGK